MGGGNGTGSWQKREEKEMNPILWGPQIRLEGAEGGEDLPPTPLLRTSSLDTPIPLTTAPEASGAGGDIPGELGGPWPQGRGGASWVTPWTVARQVSLSRGSSEILSF